MSSLTKTESTVTRRVVLVVSCLTVLCASSAQATTYYVSPSGEDANPGTAAKPFRTLAAACKTVPAGKNTIRLEAGRYDETEQSRVPPGVSVVGAGPQKTVLHWSVVVDMEKNSGRIEPDAFLIRVEDSENASLSGFSIDGKLESADPLRDRANGGIFASKVKNIRIHDITARSFNFGAIYLSEGTDSQVYQCRVEDSGHPHKHGCTGGIVVGDVTDSSIHDNVIREDRGAYGIKGAKLSWDYPANQPPLWQRKGDNRLRLVRAKFYNNDIKVRQVGGWGQGQPNMAMELWNSRPEECEIYGNTFNECTSLTGDFSASKTYRVHHNRFIVERGYSYALEADTQDMEIDHNYFANGYYPIACFGHTKEGLNIHHNVFDDIEGIQLLYFNQGVKNFRFENNTVYLKKTFPILVLNSRTSENVRVVNNLFYKEGTSHAPVFLKLGVNDKKPTDSATVKEGTLIIENNAFCNWKPEGEHPLIGDPAFMATGRRDNFDFFRLRPESRLIGAGIGATAPVKR